MTRSDPAARRHPETLTRLYAAKARAEIAEADRLLGGPFAVKGGGDPLARALLVKGTPGPSDVPARRALAGPDGDAAAKALEALGWDPSSVWAFCSRPRAADPGARAERIARIVESVDPAVVLALDAEAAEDLATATGTGALPPGKPRTVRGRVVGSVDGLEASLPDVRAKARVWRQMQQVFRAADSGGRPAGA